MTLLTIAHRIADYTNGPRPTTIGGSTNPDALKYLRLINKVGQRIMKDYNWDILRKEHTFNGSGVEVLIPAASMPSDFDRFIPETFWNRTSSDLLSGPISSSEWQGLKVSTTSPQNYKFIYRGGDILSNPVQTVGSTLVFEYISNQYVRTSEDAPLSAFVSDSDTSLIDEELIALAATYDYLSSEGLPAGAAYQDYKNYYDMLQKNENGTNQIAVSGDIFARDSRHYTGAPVASRTSYLGA